MLDSTARSSGVEELALEVDGRSIGVPHAPLGHFMCVHWGVRDRQEPQRPLDRATTNHVRTVLPVMGTGEYPNCIARKFKDILVCAPLLQCQYYGRKRSKRAVILMGLTLTMVSGGFEAGMIFAVRPAFNRGNTAPVTFVGIVSTVLLSCGLLPQYYEIHKYKEVVGVSLMFMFVDMMGGVFSAMSLAFKERFDVVAGVAYSLVVVLDGIVLLCALILNPRAKRRRKELEAIVAEEQAEPAPAEQETTAMRDVEAPPSTDQVDDKPQVDSGKIASDIEMTVMDMSLKLLTRSYPSRLDTTWREAPD